LDFVLFWDVEFLVHFVLHLLAREDPHQLQDILLDLECVLAGVSALTSIEFIAVQRLHLLGHLLVDLREAIFTVSLAPEQTANFFAEGIVQLLFGLFPHLNEEL